MLYQEYYIKLCVWYYFFGALHELTHIIACFVDPSLELYHGIFKGGLCRAMWKILFERHCIIPSVNNLNHDETYEWIVLNFIRHIAWVASVSIALKLNFYSYNKDRGKSKGCSTSNAVLLQPMVLAANITALEAISTDLLGFPVLPFFIKTLTTDPEVFFCGNFGVIFINSTWMVADEGKSALDLIEKMVNVTQIRGAQSGGVVTFSNSKNSENHLQLTGIRSRVLNRKRSDLSTMLRKKVQADVFPNFISRLFRKSANGSDDSVHSFVGHTRFATSSKASFDGTHPHIWTPLTTWKVCNHFLGLSNKNKDIALKRRQREDMPTFSIAKVENYITHNGDFDFYQLNGMTYDLHTVQKWLEVVTHSPMPSLVDSAAIAGMIDLLRTQGSFGLSIRYAISLGLSTSKIDKDAAIFPSQNDFEKAGHYFEAALTELLRSKSIDSISECEIERSNLAKVVSMKLQNNLGKISKEIKRHITDDEEGASLFHFITVTINAFFDNDLFFSTKTFLTHAKGSFGLCVTSSLDAHRQICFAARGQTMSIAFYPTKGMICYGSEQAAVKAGMAVPFPGALPDVLEKTHLDVDNDTLRLDLDDVSGEICLLDWFGNRHINQDISKCNKNLVTRYPVMNGLVNVFLYQESKTTKQSPLLYHRMTRLSGNKFIKPLVDNVDDLVLQDIQDIPKVCQAIQEDWHNIHKHSFSLNRLTAWNLARSIRRCLDSRIKGFTQNRVETIDLLVTGCEVSLWLAEQFASDLQKSFPNLRIKVVSSNKLLALYGQEVRIPATGYPMSQKTQELQDTVAVIISHSGGTFSPLACSSLLQSFTKDIFVVTSEWDTQIGKQLRSMNEDGDSSTLLFNSHIFTTEVGMRPAEASSVSVAATQQLLTNIFEHICLVILSSHEYRHFSGAVITERDLKVLERCNIENIEALESIVGVDARGNKIDSEVEKETRRLGDIWSEHILENAKAYIMSFIYIVVTVTVGYPFITLISIVAGLDSISNIFYLG